MSLFKQKNSVLALLIVIVAIARLALHPFGVTPVGALGLF